MDAPTLDYEKASSVFAQGGLIAGVDEVGRGPLAGPVVAAAVMLDFQKIPEGLADSKKLTLKKRTALEAAIRQHAVAVATGMATVREIDRLNILQASLLAMRRALEVLHPTPAFSLIDGNRLPDALPCPAQTVIKGDSRSASIAAASIIAKVFRDRLMTQLHQDFPAYGWDRNAGYGVAHHLAALDLVGASPHHRRSFAPVAKVLAKNRLINT